MAGYTYLRQLVSRQAHAAATASSFLLVYSCCVKLWEVGKIQGAGPSLVGGYIAGKRGGQGAQASSPSGAFKPAVVSIMRVINQQAEPHATPGLTSPDLTTYQKSPTAAHARTSLRQRHPQLGHPSDDVFQERSGHPGVRGSEQHAGEVTGVK